MGPTENQRRMTPGPSIGLHGFLANPLAGALRCRPHGRRVACCRGRLRVPRRRDVLRGRGSTSGVRLCRPAALRRRSCPPRRSHCSGLPPTAVRAPPAIEMGLIVVLTALIARDLGGSRRAQALAATTAALSGYLGAGHLDTTTDPDLLAWAVIAWLLVKLLAGGRPTPVARAGRHDRDRPPEQGHVPVPGRGPGGGPRPHPSLGCHPVALGGAGLGISPPIRVRCRLAGRTAGHKRRWRRRSAGTPPTTGRRWCPCCGCSPGRCPGERRRLGLGARSTSAAKWRALLIAALVALALVFVSGGKAYYVLGSLPLFMAAAAFSLTAGWLVVTSESRRRASQSRPLLSVA